MTPEHILEGIQLHYPIFLVNRSCIDFFSLFSYICSEIVGNFSEAVFSIYFIICNVIMRGKGPERWSGLEREEP
jgi:hypothetical protein